MADFERPINAKNAEIARYVSPFVNIAWAPALLSVRRALEHRMDGLNRSSHPARGEFHELMSDGVILWHLSTSEKSHLWCMAYDLPDGFWFVLDDDPRGGKPYKVAEQHLDIVTLVERAEALRRSLVRCGWVDVDVE